MNVFQRSTVTKVLAYAKPYLILMTGEMAAAYAAKVRKEAR
jgi:hypothetical protein